jgi:hypothetical protein
MPNVPLVSTQLEAREAILTPNIESSTGLISINSTTNLNAQLNQFDNNIIQDSSGPLVKIEQNPNYNSQYYGTQLYWDSVNGNAGLNIGEKQKAELVVNAWEGPYDEVLKVIVDSTGVAFTDFQPNYQPNTWLSVPRYGVPTLQRGINVVGGTTNNVVTVNNNGGFAVMNFAEGSLFEIYLDAGTPLAIDAENIQPGQTINLLVNQNPGIAGTVTLDAKFKQPDGSPYVPSTDLGAQDILTFMTFNDTNSVYVVAINKFI